MCKIYYYVCNVSYTVTIAILTVIAVERWSYLILSYLCFKTYARSATTPGTCVTPPPSRFSLLLLWRDGYILFYLILSLFQAMCKIYYYVCNVSYTASFAILTVTAVERWLYLILSYLISVSRHMQDLLLRLERVLHRLHRDSHCYCCGEMVILFYPICSLFQAMCKIYYYVCNVSYTASIAILTVTAVERWLYLILSYLISVSGHVQDLLLRLQRELHHLHRDSHCYCCGEMVISYFILSYLCFRPCARSTTTSAT